MAQEAIEQATRQLIGTIRDSEEYTVYQALKEAVMSDNTNCAMLAEYQKAQIELQAAAVCGKNADAEATQRFSRLSSLLFMNNEVAQYLMAQLQLQKIVGEICQRMMDAAGLEVRLPGM